jgi:hypothetical protein
MVNKEIILKSLDDAILKCQPKYESMHTVKQIAKYFHLKYELISNDDIPEGYNTRYTEGKVHSFTDTDNDCKIFVFDDLIEKKTGLLKSEWYRTEFELEDKENWSDEEIKEAIETSTYPLKQFIKDYMELPDEFKESIGELTFSYKTREGALGTTSGLTAEGKDNKSSIQMYSDSIDVVGFSDVIQSNPRTVFFHEVGHSISRKLAYDSKEGYNWDYNPDYLAQTKEYKKGRSADKKLNGDKYATSYGKSSKDFTEEQADVTMAMLLKASSKDDSNYGKYKIALASAYNKGVYESEDHLSVDDFLERYPNRVSALNKYLKLEL